MNTNTEYDPLPPGLFVWMDLEYTTTDVDTARVLEVAAIITNRQLGQIGEPFSLTCKPDDFSGHSMSESVVDMHTQNGLLDDVSASAYNGGRTRKASAQLATANRKRRCFNSLRLLSAMRSRDPRETHARAVRAFGIPAT
ncbi:hypothetical protein FBF32_02450 [Candidatus Saccharibacteria bacterium oral taxon 488]|nr:hypothetical protein FBF32_02450 [Candidatus Saccharibacteria bacterium oral taxon 488]